MPSTSKILVWFLDYFLDYLTFFLLTLKLSSKWNNRWWMLRIFFGLIWKGSILWFFYKINSCSMITVFMVESLLMLFIHLFKFVSFRNDNQFISIISNKVTNILLAKIHKKWFFSVNDKIIKNNGVRYFENFFGALIDNTEWINTTSYSQNTTMKLRWMIRYLLYYKEKDISLVNEIDQSNDHHDHTYRTIFFSWNFLMGYSFHNWEI